MAQSKKAPIHLTSALLQAMAADPLPASLQPTTAAATSASRRARRRKSAFGGGYGGLLPPKPEAAPAPTLPTPQPLADAAASAAAISRPAIGASNNSASAIPDRRRRRHGGTPLTEANIRSTIQTAKDAGLVAYNAMINLPSSVIYGKDTRAKDMEPFIASIEAAGKAGLPVLEYNFYAHRVIEGYYETVGRANAGYTAFDYDLDVLIDDTGRVVQPIFRDETGQITPQTLAAFPNAKQVKIKDLPPLANEGAHNLTEMWANVTYFLKAAIPVAEKAGVRMALHPNDPPAPISRGSRQIMGTVEGWKHFIDLIVNSPSNGITFDCGVTREMGGDADTGGRLFRQPQKRINHVHFRNVQVVKPYEKYQEVFIDTGMGDMFGVMKALR